MRGETVEDEYDEVSPIEEVRLTVSTKDDPYLPAWTFRVWSLGLPFCLLLSFLNTFFAFRTQPLVISMIPVQVVTLPLGRFMEKVLPKKTFRIPGFGNEEFTLNPGPFNMKEHVLISVFANAGAGFGAGAAYAVSIVTIIKALYRRHICFLASWILVITTQILGYGWAGALRKYVVDPGEMWWPSSLVQVSLFRALHEIDDNRMSRGKFFLIALTCSFCWYAIPGYIFPTLSTISWVCWVFPNSTLAQQLGSGMHGLGLGAFSLDWSVMDSYLGSPLITPFFAIVNVFVGFFLVMYVVTPIAYWGFNLFDARTFPFFSSHMFNEVGQIYNVSAIVNSDFELDIPAYERQGRIYISMLFALSYGIGFAAIISTLTHVAFFNGRDIYERFQDSTQRKEDIHAKLMMKYEPIPNWWFHSLLVVSLILSLLLCTLMEGDIQLPWWGFVFATGLALIFTLPISIITATTNVSPGLNILTEYLMGIIYPGRPIANVCFKTYAYISMGQAISFLSDLKLGHYMKIPKKAMFVVQLLGTIIAGSVNIIVAWYLLTSVENICQDQLLPPNSPWTCPGERIFFDASVIWGLVGPNRIFGSEGNYPALNWFFLGGALAPVIVWLLHKAFPQHRWIAFIHIPVLLGATHALPPATTLNFNTWITVGTIFNYFIFRYQKVMWQRYNYVLSAALDAGLAFMGVLLYFTVATENRSINWWGSQGEHCDLATCPTTAGVAVDGCPVLY
ncbi:hypothetical protein Pint_08531 [Pistacia integerrima]|uniref:Uncharacterized protein n=1 Tax=Pistacia integerrima TaxID=434235 RepID=A0ACC0XVU0_9ROSI|nr:hypothetical protein Pint_08531 [Pistacia integerrima]